MDTRLNPERSLSDILSRVVAQEDSDRLKSMTELLNSFNVAVQVQGNRNRWNAKDFRLFAIALCAMEQVNQETEEEHDVNA